MSGKQQSKRVTIEQKPVVIPDFSIKELLAVIPPHCYKRSTLRSLSYVMMDLTIIASLCKLSYVLDGLLTPEYISLPYTALYPAARFSVWALYSFISGLFGFGLWSIAHECGHYGFSEYKWVNHAVGWVLHSGLGVPYFSWRISHAKHHAATSHVDRDEVYVPRTRTEMGLPPFDPKNEDVLGSSVSENLQRELWEAIGDSPIGGLLTNVAYLVLGWPAYVFVNASGNSGYPKGTNHVSSASPIFRPEHRSHVILSNIGIMVWLWAVYLSISRWGFFEVFRAYGATYLWVNHWLILITFLQHADPLIPHYRQSEFTFARGALSTINRNLLGDLGSTMGRFGAFATHGVSEIHVVHHVSSKIPHYHAWEAMDALRRLLSTRGICLDGRPGGWAEMYRVFRECKFVEDEGGVVFYKNAYGLAAGRPVAMENATDVHDSGVDLGVSSDSD
ncbi:fatty acid desaturase-domain-containing protein [Trametes elegans]|nr:fatty acid desaturase-domain-containing protein [Trametes elegans]